MCIVWTISVLLWTITIINFNRALESFCTKDDFNFTNFLINEVMNLEMLYERCQSFLLLQSGLKQLLSEILTDKFHYYLLQLA